MVASLEMARKGIKTCVFATATPPRNGLVIRTIRLKLLPKVAMVVNAGYNRLSYEKTYDCHENQVPEYVPRKTPGDPRAS